MQAFLNFINKIILGFFDYTAPFGLILWTFVALTLVFALLGVVFYGDSI